MSFTDAVRICVRDKYATFDGRAGLREYWWFFLATYVIGAAGYVVALILLAFAGIDNFIGVLFRIALILWWIVFIVVAVGLIVPMLAVTARRLHDTGKSGWMQLLFFIPCVGWIIMIIFCVQQGTPGDNAYGAKSE